MNGSDNNTITGKITHVLEHMTGESKRKPGEMWHKQEYVLETFAEWPRQVCFQLWGEDRINQANIQLGDIVTVQYELSSREYNGRWYTSVDGRFVTKGMPQEQVPQYGQQAPQYGAGQPNFGPNPNFGPQQQQPNAPIPPAGGVAMPQTQNNFGEASQPDDLPF